MAHTAGASLRVGVDGAKLAAIWEYRKSPLYSEAERIGLDFAIAAASQPNIDAMKRHWNEGEIVEIVAVVAFFGFMNRWNHSMATPLEDGPRKVGEKFLAPHGWTVGKHRA